MTALAEGEMTATERADLLQTLDTHRGFLRFTAQGISDEDARRRTTVSALTIGGLIKHVTRGEEQWADFAVRGPEAIGNFDPASIEAHASTFEMGADETLAGLLQRYEEVARRTDDLVRTSSSLDASYPLPEAPWFEPGARWSARRALLHIIAETAQHAGHADIIREALDGQKTMG